MCVSAYVCMHTCLYIYEIFVQASLRQLACHTLALMQTCKYHSVMDRGQDTCAICLDQFYPKQVVFSAHHFCLAAFFPHSTLLSKPKLVKIHLLWRASLINPKIKSATKEISTNNKLLHNRFEGLKFFIYSFQFFWETMVMF